MKPLLIESSGSILQDYIEHFSYYACEKLGIPSCPPIGLVSKTGTSSFGNYNLSTKVITVATDGRHIADILRTLAHELVHEYQHLDGPPLQSLFELEYEANAIAGMIMREYNKMYPELYDAEPEEVEAVPEVQTEPVLSDTGNPGAAQGSLENSGVTVDTLQPQLPTYQEGGVSAHDPTRPTGPIEMAEEAPVNAASAGNVDGIGIGAKGEPGIHPNKLNKKDHVLKRKTLQQFKHGLQ